MPEKGANDLRYSDVERALSSAFGIRAEDMGQFRARIFHLRRVNVAGLPQTGRGRQIVYTLEHVRMIFLALRLNQLGMMPDTLGRMFRTKRALIIAWFQRAAARPDEPFRVALQLSAFGGLAGAEEDGPDVLAATLGPEGPGIDNPFSEMLEHHIWIGYDRSGNVVVRNRLIATDRPYIVLNITAIEKSIQTALAEVTAQAAE